MAYVWYYRSYDYSGKRVIFLYTKINGQLLL